MTRTRERVKPEESEQDSMPVPIKVNSTEVVITPLFDMQCKETLHSYRKGIRSQIQYERGHYPIRELVSFLKLTIRRNFFDRKSAADIYRFVGFEFGCIHGGILAPERTLRPDVATLVTFDDSQDAIQGYKAGRQWFFEEADAFMKEYLAQEPDQERQRQDTEPLTVIVPESAIVL